MFKPWLGISLAILVTPVLALSATDSASVRFSSGEDRVVLLELFTSEGCSSCPPADRWLSKLKKDKGLWRDYVPIAFHVDYWDYIGWQDPFASNDNSDRQRRYALEGGVQFVYTPGFLSNGQEWLGWRDGESIRAVPTYAGNLSILVDGDDVAVHFENTRLDDANLSAHVALLGMNVESDVRAGENKGRLLRHDFVALNIVTARLQQTAGGFKAETKIPTSDGRSNDNALVVWVSGDEAQSPLQAVGGFLPGPAPRVSVTP